MTERQPAPLASIEDAIVKDFNGNEIAAKTLWAEQPVCFLLIRRPGCVLCRAEARRIWEFKEAFDELGVRPVCLVHEWMKAEVGAFKPKFWGGDLYLDKNKDIYKAIGEGKIRKGSWLKFACGFCCLVPKYNEAKKIAPDAEQNVAGTHMVMGGMMVVKQGSKGVQSMFTEDNFGDHPDHARVLKDCATAAGKPLSQAMRAKFDCTKLSNEPSV